MVAGHFAGNWKTNFDPETGVPTINVSSGSYWNIQLPGYGNVFKIVGMEVKKYDPDVDDWVVIKQAGLQTIDVVPICEYLLPPP